MSRLWDAGRTVPLELARELIAAQFPELAPVHVEPLGQGWDNVAFRVNETLVFRFPRRQVGLDYMKTELRVLPSIAAHVPVPISAPKYHGQPSAEFDWPFGGYRAIPGRTACLAKLDDTQRTGNAERLGDFLAALHSIAPTQAKQWGAPIDLLGRLDPERRVPQTYEHLEKLSAWGLIDNLRPWHLIIERTEFPTTLADDYLVHGDLYARHLIVDDSGDLTGVIDWGDVHIGHPACDLAIAHSFLPPDAHDRFRTAYGEISETTWQLARFRVLNHASITATFAYETGDQAFLRESLIALQHLVLV